MIKKWTSIAVAILISVFVLGYAGTAYAAPLKDDESITLSYKKGNINCLIKWSYAYNEVAYYEILVEKDGSFVVDPVTEYLQKPSSRGRVTYKVAATTPGTYHFTVLLRNAYGGTINFPPDYYYYTIE